MKKLFLTFLTISILLLFPFHESIFAKSKEDLPITQSSSQWKLTLNNADDKESKLNKSDRPDLYKMYSIDINTNNEDVRLLSVQAFRGDSKERKKYELFNFDEKDLTPQTSFHHPNLPVYAKANELIVVVTWTDKGTEKEVDTRNYMEQFVFNLK